MLNEKANLEDYCWIDVSFQVRYILVPKDDEDKVLKRFYTAKYESNITELFGDNYPFSAISKEKLKDLDPFLATLCFYLNQTLRRIEDKIDTLIKKQSNPQKEETPIVYNSRCINLSGEGIILNSSTPLKRGDLIKATIVLPIYPPYLINVLAKVIKVIDSNDNDASHNEYTSILKFESIFEDDRDEIFRYITDKQREQIRNKR